MPSVLQVKGDGCRAVIAASAARALFQAPDSDLMSLDQHCA